MALKFKPVVVTAVLISVIYFKLDPLFSVKKNYGPVRDSYVRALAVLKFCSHEQSSLSNGCRFIKY